MTVMRHAKARLPCYSMWDHGVPTNMASLESLVIHREVFIPNREIGRFSLFYQKSGDLPQNRETWKLWVWSKHTSENTQFTSVMTLCHVKPSNRATGLLTAAVRLRSHWRGCPPGNARLPPQGPTGSVAQCSRLADAARGRGTSVGACEQPVPGCKQAPLLWFCSHHRWWHADSGC